MERLQSTDCLDLFLEQSIFAGSTLPGLDLDPSSIPPAPTQGSPVSIVRATQGSLPTPPISDLEMDCVGQNSDKNKNNSSSKTSNNSNNKHHSSTDPHAEAKTPDAPEPSHHEQQRQPPGPGWLSPLHLAAQRGHDKIVRLLIQHSPESCDDKDSEGGTPLMLAVAGGFEDVARTLLQHGARVSETDAGGRSSVHWAVIHRRERLLRLLLENCHGLAAAINRYDANGWTPLHTAIDIGFEAGVQTLLRYGANTRLKCGNHHQWNQQPEL